MSKRKKTSSSIYESFSDLALMTLGTFIFLFVTIVTTTEMSEKSEIPELKRQLEFLQKELQLSESDKERLKKDLERVIITDPEGEEQIIMQAAHVGRKDFDLFIKGLKDIPGKDIHLIVDATGSMHGVSGFLIPMLRLIVTRSGKELSALTWFSNFTTKTLTGSMAEIFDQLIVGAPFSGSVENIGQAFRGAAQEAPLPGAYLLIGDEPGDDTVQYSDIHSPVFTLPFGISDPDTEREYALIAQKTGGKQLRLDFR